MATAKQAFNAETEQRLSAAKDAIRDTALINALEVLVLIGGVKLGAHMYKHTVDKYFRFFGIVEAAASMNQSGSKAPPPSSASDVAFRIAEDIIKGDEKKKEEKKKEEEKKEEPDLTFKIKPDCPYNAVKLNQFMAVYNYLKAVGKNRTKEQNDQMRRVQTILEDCGVL